MLLENFVQEGYWGIGETSVIIAEDKAVPVEYFIINEIYWGKKNMAEQAEAPHENNVAPAKEARCVTLTGYGGMRMVKVQKKPEPSPGEGEVTVRVKAW